MYIGETEGRLNGRKNSQYRTSTPLTPLQPYDHPVLSMRVTILEIIDHHTNSPCLCTPLRRQKKERRILEKETVVSYGRNDKIISVIDISSPGCSSWNVVSLLISQPTRGEANDKINSVSDISSPGYSSLNVVSLLINQPIRREAMLTSPTIQSF